MKFGDIGFSINKDQIYIQIPDHIHNNYGICMLLKNKDIVKIMEFKSRCISLFNSKCINWFLKDFPRHGGSNEWCYCYFELWGLKNQDLIFNLGQQLADYFQLPLEI